MIILVIVREDAFIVSCKKYNTIIQSKAKNQFNLPVECNIRAFAKL